MHWTPSSSAFPIEVALSDSAPDQLRLDSISRQNDFFRNSNRDIIQRGMLNIFSIDTDAIFSGSLARPIAKGALSEATKSKQLLFRKLISVD